MYEIDTLFRCREIILNTNIDIIDGFERVLKEWDEYLKYYDKYSNYKDYDIDDNEMTIIENNIDMNISDLSRNIDNYYLTDNIIKMSMDGNYVLLGSAKSNEWLSLSEFDALLDKHIKERLENALAKSKIIKTEQKEKKELTLDELLIFFDELEDDKNLKKFFEGTEENKNIISEEDNSINSVDNIIEMLGLS